MLNKFNSHTKKLNRVIQKINSNDLNKNDLTGSLLSIKIPAESITPSNTRLQSSIPTIINTKNEVVLDLTGSLLSIDVPNETKYDINSKENPNPNKVINNKNKIDDFRQEILKYGVRYIKRSVDNVTNIDYGILTIYDALLDYGANGILSDDFEIFVAGLQIPTDYTVTQVDNDVVIKLRGNYIDFESTDLSSIYVFGKFIY